MLVQNSAKSKSLYPEAMCASEFRMLMEAGFMRDFMQRSLGGELGEDTRAVWDQKCKAYYEAMGSPAGITWHDVLITFGISLDNAPIHIAFKREMLRPRVSIQAEFRTLFEHAVTGLHFVIDTACAEAAAAVIDKYEKLAGRAKKRANANQHMHKIAVVNDIMARTTGTDIYVMNQFKRFPFRGQEMGLKKTLAKEIFEQLQLKFEAARKTYRDQNMGVDWVSVFRREQAFRDPRWLCFLPEQLMPLGNSTPDLHQCAELLVGISKRAMRMWVLSNDPDSKEVLYARNYDAELRKDCDKRNEPQAAGPTKDQTTIRNSIKRTWITAQIVAKPYGGWFHPRKPPDANTEDCELEDYQVMGTGGRFPGKEWA